MITRTALRLTTAVALAASLAGLGVGAASTASATTSFPCSDSGVGSTLGLAVNNAEMNLRGDYTILSGFTVSYDTQEADGSWYAVVSARCGEPR
jgi:hypothetical protein